MSMMRTFHGLRIHASLSKEVLFSSFDEIIQSFSEEEEKMRPSRNEGKTTTQLKLILGYVSI